MDKRYNRYNRPRNSFFSKITAYTFVKIFFVFFLFFSVGAGISCFKTSLMFYSLPDLSEEEEREEFRAMEVDEKILRLYYEKRDSFFSPFVSGVTEKKDSGKILKDLFSDWRCFPVPADPKKKATIEFEDSWGGARSFGGERRHEGTDLMASNNERGYFPIVSVSDGIVEKKGWLTLGGWRLGIRSEHGIYFYYAHMERYAEGIEEGSEVKAGQIIGYMGDSGYGEEGTVGQFAVHLHFGIYVTIDGEEVSLNPYPLLKIYDS